MVAAEKAVEHEDDACGGGGGECKSAPVPRAHHQMRDQGYLATGRKAAGSSPRELRDFLRRRLRGGGEPLSLGYSPVERITWGG